MGSQQISAESEKHFKDNWSKTPLEYITLSAPLDTSSLNEYISIKYFSVLNKRTGMDAIGDRVATYGYLRVMVYQKSEILALGLADDVIDFFSNVNLPLDIHVDIGQAGAVIDMTNTWHEVKLTFDICQYS